MTGVVESNNQTLSGSRNGRFRAQFWKTDLCRFWHSGCRNGKSCPFAHGEEELSSRPDLAKTSLCQRWAKGSCPLDASECRFAHGHLDLRTTINFGPSPPQIELDMNSQMENEPGILQAEVPILSTGPGSPLPLGNQHSRPPIQPPPPRTWEEENLSNLHAYNSMGPSADMSHDRQSHCSQWNEAVFAHRPDSLWSAEFSDTTALDFAGVEDIWNHHSQVHAKATHEFGLTAPSVASMAPDPAVSSNGRQLPPPPFQQVLPMGGQMHPAGQLHVNGKVTHEGLPCFTSIDSPWGQPWGGSAVDNGGWPDPVRAFTPLAQQPRQNYSSPAGAEHVSELPIKPLEVNAMHSLVPEELRAIWG